MGRSMAEYLHSDMDCEGLLECLHGLTDLDRDCFQVLHRTDRTMTVDELAAALDRERSTVYRSVQRLTAAGIVTKEQVNDDEGGYHHVYRPASTDAVAADMRRLLDDWYATTGQLIATFEDRYGDREPGPDGEMRDPAPVAVDDA